MSIRARAWTALLLPPFAWYAFQQGVSAMLHADCTRSGIAAVWGAASLALCALALRIGWRLRRMSDVLADPWLARLALAIAGLFGLAIAFQTLAIVMVPACLR